MTDNAGSDRPIASDTPLDPAEPRFVPGAEPPSTTPPSTAGAPASPAPGKMRPVIIIGVIVAFLAIVLFAVRNNVAADDLKVGECFNIPDGVTITTVEKYPCTEPHNAEVIYVGELTDESSYPITMSLDRYVDTSCVPAFETYLGRDVDSEPALVIGYFYPTRDGWDGGDRMIMCYVAQPDESQMTRSLKP